MKYPLINKRQAMNFPGILPSANPSFGKQARTGGFQQHKPYHRKIHNNISGSFGEYTSLAQAAIGQGNRVLGETYYQYAEHALRLNNQDKEDAH